jgi:hypothetical protein
MHDRLALGRIQILKPTLAFCIHVTAERAPLAQKGFLSIPAPNTRQFEAWHWMDTLQLSSPSSTIASRGESTLSGTQIKESETSRSQRKERVDRRLGFITSRMVIAQKTMFHREKD